MSTKVGSIHYDLSINSKEFDDQIKNVSDKLKSAGNSMVSFGRTMTTAVTLPLAAFTGGMVLSAAALEKTAASFNVLVGEGTKARKLFADIKKFADTTPFEFPELAKAATTMLGYGVAAEDVMDRLKRLGDAAAASGGDLNGITLAYSQMIGRGKVTGDNLRQLTENMVTLRAELSKVSGIPINQLDKAIEGGLITTEMLNQALDMATNQGGKFFGGTEKLAQTFSGRLSTVKDQLLEVGRNLIGVKVDPELGLTVQKGGIFDRLSELLPKIAEAAKKLADAFASLSPKQQDVAIGSTAAVAAAGPLALVMGQLSKAVSGLIPLMSNPIFWIVVGIIAAIAAMVALVYFNWERLVKFYKSQIEPALVDMAMKFKPVGEEINRVINLIKDLFIPILEEAWNFMVNSFGPAWEDIKKGVQDFNTAMQPIAPYIQQFLNVALVGLVQAIAGVVGGIVLVISWVFQFIGAFVRLYGWLAQVQGAMASFVSRGIQSIVSGIQNMISTINSFIGQMWNAGSRIVDGFISGITSGFNRAVGTVRVALAQIRRLLPFSPAKEGPFSGKGWTLYSGQSLMQGLADGIRQNSSLPQLALDRAMAGAQFSIGNAGNTASAPVTNTSININGDITLGNQSAVNEFFSRLNRNNELAQKGMAII